MSDTLWYKDAVFYELHVKAFQDSSNDGVGDFEGLIQRLDYVAGLGVDVIWLLPFYPSPLRDDGYDIADYYGVHPNYGTLDQVQHFLDEAHKRGLKVIADLVLNHTSSDHPWFQRARRAPKGSPERDFYVWSDDDTLYREARIIFTDTEPSNWSWDPVAQQYYWHRFFSHQPDLNWDNPEVKETMFQVMEYWLERGLDGFRADAVPYLIEREGTICENLPETHDILKEFRVRLESRYPGRVLLAEANQWPEDVRPYFGDDGEEFHMAFHFPLMPRIFMAVRQGIRKPIVEIIERTPSIPDDCQWCMFLRNHDELTLEMVTDEERDYMYREYAADPRMRINLGIRRRLAPLMENDRRKIELLNSILFTMPGSPIIYYGDEIGMGDNVWLGDRDGVRTPMQWSPDRNAGFSRAEPERLYLPAISDAVYGYQAVNVEAQERSPFSLLNWTKRLIRVRKQHRAFGRGSITFLQPENPHVLAYLREYQGDVILVVNNLSASAQAVQLDLAAYNGHTPVEMLGETAFPPVDETPYSITLSPYGFFWFALRQVRAAGEEDFWQMPEEWARQEAELIADPQAVSEAFNALPREWLLRQRWFRDKAREVSEICLHDHGVLHAERAPNIILAVLEVRFMEGGRDLYLLPATFHPVAAPGSGPEPLVTHATLRGEARVYEAVGERRIAGTLLDTVVGGQRIEGRTGVFQGHATGWMELADVPRGPVRLIGAEQSNTSLVFGEQLVMKIFRKLEGINPDLEVTRFLVERAGFRSVPALAGWLDYTPGGGGQPHAVAGVFQFVPNGGDAWSVALKALDRYLSAASRSAADPETVTGREAVRRMAGDFFPALERLGQTTARMHLALASVDDDDAFAPERIDEDDVQRAIEGFRRQVDTVLTDLGRQLEAIPGSFPAAVQGALREVVRAAPDLRHRAEDLRALTGQTDKVRIHGDYHLGQVLRADQDAPGGSEWYVLDFEGEPARPLADRRSKQTVLRDVAGMLRSFNYAVRMAMHEFRTDDLRVRMSLERWAQAWETEARSLFLDAYVRTTQGSSIIPRDPDVLARALAVFELEKAVYELGYEMNNRPDWLWVPVEGIRAILGGRA